MYVPVCSCTRLLVVFYVTVTFFLRHRDPLLPHINKPALERPSSDRLSMQPNSQNISAIPTTSSFFFFQYITNKQCFFVSPFLCFFFIFFFSKVKKKLGSGVQNRVGRKPETFEGYLLFSDS